MAQIQSVCSVVGGIGWLTVEQHDAADGGERGGLRGDRREEGLKDSCSEGLEMFRNFVWGVCLGGGRCEVIHD